MSDNIPEVFADGIINVSHANGVFRITFGQQELKGAVKPTMKLMLPASQITPVIQALTGAVTDIDKKIRENVKKPAAKKQVAKKTVPKKAVEKKPAAKARTKK